MKRIGSFFEYEKQRNDDLLRAYRKDIETCKVIRMPEVWQRVANSPSVRFWVSEERAAIVVAQMMKGDRLSNMRPLKKEMYYEIFRRVRKQLRQYPQMSVLTACIKVVNSPAPKFYMTPKSVKVTIYKIKNQYFEKRKKLLMHTFY